VLFRSPNCAPAGRLRAEKVKEEDL